MIRPLLVVLLFACTSSEKERVGEARAAIGSAGATCTHYYGKHGTVAFCVDGTRMSVCTKNGCVATEACRP